MASFTETRKDIFKFNSQGQLELPELTAKSASNNIEFRINDGIYVNGTRLQPGGGGGGGNTVNADYTQAVQPLLTITDPVPFGSTRLHFESLSQTFIHISSTEVEIPFTENPLTPFSSFTHIIPIVRQMSGKANKLYGIFFESSHSLDAVSNILTLTISFADPYSFGSPMDGYELHIDFLIA